MKTALLFLVLLCPVLAHAELTNYFIEVNSTGTVLSCSGFPVEGVRPMIINPEESIYQLPVTRTEWSNAVISKLPAKTVQDRLASTKAKLADVTARNQDVAAAIMGLMDALNAKLPSQYRVTTNDVQAAIKVRYTNTVTATSVSQ